MAKTLTANATAGVSAVITAPRLLLQIGWSPTVRICTRETVVWNGQTWLGGIGRVEDVRGSAASQSCRIVLPNHDGAYGAIALTQGLQDIAVAIWALYGTAPFAAGDAVPVFVGAMDGGRVTATEVAVDCIAMRGASMYAPRIYAHPPLCNHNQPTGTTLAWNGATFVLERR